MIGLRKFRLVSADARRGGTRDEFLRESAGEATGVCFFGQLIQISCSFEPRKHCPAIVGYDRFMYIKLKLRSNSVKRTRSSI